MNVKHGCQTAQTWWLRKWDLDRYGIVHPLHNIPTLVIETGLNQSCFNCRTCPTPTRWSMTSQILKREKLKAKGFGSQLPFSVLSASHPSSCLSFIWLSCLGPYLKGTFIVFVWSQFDGGKIDNRTIGLWFPPKPRRSQAREYGEETLFKWIRTITLLGD